MSLSSQRAVPPASKPSLFTDGRMIGTLALALGVGSHAINGFVATAVLPDIIRDLGGQDRAFWVFSSFEMLAILAGCLTGATKVRFGARGPFMAATAILAGGSILAGLSPNLEGLIAGRALQGFGEGMIVALCYALIPDLYPSNMAPRIFALLAGIWALAAGLGPVSAGLLTEVWSWRAAFLINIPLTLLLFFLMNSALPARHPTPRKRRQDQPRSDLFGLAARFGLLILCIFALTFIGEVHQPVPLTVMIVAGLGHAVALLSFDAQSATRLFPREAFRPQTLIGLGTWIVFLISVTAAVRAIFVTTFGQVYWGLNVTEASYVAAALAFSWSIFSWISSKAPNREVELIYLAIGPLLIAAGLGLTAYAIETRSLQMFIAASIIGGAGHGICNQILMRSLMYTAEGEEQGLVSSILPTISSAGVAIGGGLTGLLAVLTGLVTADTQGLITAVSIETAGAEIFYINAILTLVPAAAMFVLRARIKRKEAATSAM